MVKTRTIKAKIKRVSLNGKKDRWDEMRRDLVPLMEKYGEYIFLVLPRNWTVSQALGAITGREV